MCYVVYILYSHKDKKLYVGCTSNLKDRIQRHSKGYIKATTHRRPLSLIHTESFGDKKTEAFKRERFLKSLWCSREKKKIVKKFLNNLAKTL